jgi:hypothetical protein
MSDTPERAGMPTRRTLLRAAGTAGLAGVAGCTSLAEESDDGDPTDETATPTPPSGAVGRVRVTEREALPELPVEPRVSVVDPFVTSESTAVLRADVENTTSDPVTVGEYRAVVFQYAHSGSGECVLLPHSERSTAGPPARSPPDVETTGGADCWQLDSKLAVTAEYGTVEIPSDGTLTAFVGVYAADESRSCLPTGEHAFESTYSVDPLDEETPDESASWGFTLAVEEL